MPSADAITIRETLDLLDGPFEAVSAAIAQRGFALWVGSGISRRRAPNVGEMLGLALEHLRQHINPADVNCRFRNALENAIALSHLPAPNRATIQFGIPFTGWPERDDIINGLWDHYAEVCAAVE